MRLYLPNRVTIRQQSTTPDALGQPANTWGDVATLWASVKHNSGAESIKAGMDTSVVRASVRIRYKAGLTAGMRVVYGAATYDIKAVLMDADGKVFTDLVCEKVNV